MVKTFAIHLTEDNLLKLADLLQADPTNSCASILANIKSTIKLPKNIPPLWSRNIIWCSKCKGSGKVYAPQDKENTNSIVDCPSCLGDGTKIEITSIRQIPNSDLWKNFFAK